MFGVTRIKSIATGDAKNCQLGVKKFANCNGGFEELKSKWCCPNVYGSVSAGREKCLFFGFF